VQIRKLCPTFPTVSTGCTEMGCGFPNLEVQSVVLSSNHAPPGEAGFAQPELWTSYPKM
jgi:hypothetical protein